MWVRSVFLHTGPLWHRQPNGWWIFQHQSSLWKFYILYCGHQQNWQISYVFLSRNVTWECDFEVQARNLLGWPHSRLPHWFLTALEDSTGSVCLRLLLISLVPFCKYSNMLSLSPFLKVYLVMCKLFFTLFICYRPKPEQTTNCQRPVTTSSLTYHLTCSLAFSLRTLLLDSSVLVLSADTRILRIPHIQNKTIGQRRSFF